MITRIYIPTPIDARDEKVATATEPYTAPLPWRQHQKAWIKTIPITLISKVVYQTHERRVERIERIWEAINHPSLWVWLLFCFGWFFSEAKRYITENMHEWSRWHAWGIKRKAKTNQPVVKRKTIDSQTKTSRAADFATRFDVIGNLAVLFVSLTATATHSYFKK